MILFLFVLAALGFFYHRVLDQHGRARTVGSWATGLVIVLSVCAIAANDAWHFGMHEQTRTTRVALTGKAVAVKPLGTKEKAYVYRTAAGVKHATPGLTTDVKLKRNNRAQASIATTRLRFNSNFSAVLFAGSGLDGKIVHQTTTLSVPHSWTLTQH